jgi:GNAT superfamily N-acetyltransferase
MRAGPPPRLVVRELAETDSIEDLTELLHRAYAPLAAQGLRYVATHQDAATTRRRIAGGEDLVAEIDGRIVGNITWHAHTFEGGKTPWYDRTDVAFFHQLCTEPGYQGRGVASRLLEEVERRARESGATELACDTALPAQHLIDWYGKRGYRIVDKADWRPVTNYESVILSKTLREPASVDSAVDGAPRSAS